MTDGKKIMLNGREFIVPPAPLSCVRRYHEVFEGTAPITILIMAEIIHAALKRNYPDLTQDELENEYLDVANMRETFNIVMNVSGAEAKK
jgi:hypothetical protein